MLIANNRRGYSKFESRLQNSRYFCVFKYSRVVKQKVWNKAENSERDWGEVFSLSPHTPHLTFFLLILRKKRLFCSLESLGQKLLNKIFHLALLLE